MIQTENKLPCAYLGSKAEESIALKSANTMYNHPNPDSKMNYWNFGVCATLPLLWSHLLHTTHTIDDSIYKTGKKALNNNNKIHQYGMVSHKVKKKKKNMVEQGNQRLNKFKKHNFIKKRPKGARLQSTPWLYKRDT